MQHAAVVFRRKRQCYGGYLDLSCSFSWFCQTLKMASRDSTIFGIVCTTHRETFHTPAPPKFNVSI